MHDLKIKIIAKVEQINNIIEADKIETLCTNTFTYLHLHNMMKHIYQQRKFLQYVSSFKLEAFPSNGFSFHLYYLYLKRNQNLLSIPSMTKIKISTFS